MKKCSGRRILWLQEIKNRREESPSQSPWELSETFWVSCQEEALLLRGSEVGTSIPGNVVATGDFNYLMMPAQATRIAISLSLGVTKYSGFGGKTPLSRSQGIQVCKSQYHHLVWINLANIMISDSGCDFLLYPYFKLIM
jgi:hypothetical protein